MHENIHTWKCGELELYFFPHPPEDEKKRKKTEGSRIQRKISAASSNLSSLLLHPSLPDAVASVVIVYDRKKTRKLVVNGIEITFPIDGRICVRTSGGDGNSWEESGTGNSRDGNETPYVGMVLGGNRNQRRERSGNRDRERNITRVPVPVLFLSRPHFPVPRLTARAPGFVSS